jgi:hypothetical protein
MTWLNRLLRRKARISLAELADFQADAILRGAADLASRVDEIAMASRAGLGTATGQLSSAAVYLECLMFLWSLADRLVVEEFPRQSRHICLAMATKVVVGTGRKESQIKALRDSRGVEYTALAINDDVDLLCGIAARRILAGEADAFPDALLMPHQMVAQELHAILVLARRDLGGLGKRFEILDT